MMSGQYFQNIKEDEGCVDMYVYFDVCTAGS